MQNILQAYSRFGNILEKILYSIIFILFFSGIWLFCYLVFMRYVMSRGYSWGDELVQAIIVTAILLASGGAVREGEHTTIDVLFIKLKGTKREMLLTAGYVISLAVCCIMGWTGIEITTILKDEGLTSTSSLPIPIWLTYIVLPIALFCCAFYYLEKTAHNIERFRVGGR